MILIEHRKLADGSELEIQHVVKPHKPKLIKQLPATKRNYKGKNPAEGRKCTLSAAVEYSPWPRKPRSLPYCVCDSQDRKWNDADPKHPGRYLASGVYSVATEWGT